MRAWLTGLLGGSALVMAMPAVARAADASPMPDAGGAASIVVTARQRPEDAQTVPAALSVVGGATLDRSYTVNTQGLAVLVARNRSSVPRPPVFTNCSRAAKLSSRGSGRRRRIC